MVTFRYNRFFPLFSWLTCDFKTHPNLHNCKIFFLGSYYGVLACVKDPSKSPPELEAIKLMHILETKNEAKSMWPIEVQELSNLLRGKIIFKV